MLFAIPRFPEFDVHINVSFIACDYHTYAKSRHFSSFRSGKLDQPTLRYTRSVLALTVSSSIRRISPAPDEESDAHKNVNVPHASRSKKNRYRSLGSSDKGQLYTADDFVSVLEPACRRKPGVIR